MDYASDMDKCQSTTGYVFTLTKPPMSWKFSLQTMVLSTTEVQYMAVTKVVKEAKLASEIA